jgi:hypothetical protein
VIQVQVGVSFNKAELSFVNCGAYWTAEQRTTPPKYLRKGRGLSVIKYVSINTEGQKFATELRINLKEGVAGHLSYPPQNAEEGSVIHVEFPSS